MWPGGSSGVPFLHLSRFITLAARESMSPRCSMATASRALMASVFLAIRLVLMSTLCERAPRFDVEDLIMKFVFSFRALMRISVVTRGEGLGSATVFGVGLVPPPLSEVSIFS